MASQPRRDLSDCQGRTVEKRPGRGVWLGYAFPSDLRWDLRRLLQATEVQKQKRWRVDPDTLLEQFGKEVQYSMYQNISGIFSSVCLFVYQTSQVPAELLRSWKIQVSAVDLSNGKTLVGH